MLDLLPQPCGRRTFANLSRPACGDGNFLVAILDRKLDRIASDLASAKSPTGSRAEYMLFHALEALASIYAVDISKDNVIGGTPGHEVGARTRL